MRLKLDLHPIYNDSRSIEEALLGSIDDAIAKHATEVEIIPGKGSGALKKSVIRFLERPEIKARYHRYDKDSDNWGRLTVYFRHERADAPSRAKPSPPGPVVLVPCACCGDSISVPTPSDAPALPILIDCPWCGSPNRVTIRSDRHGTLYGRAELDYGPK